MNVGGPVDHFGLFAGIFHDRARLARTRVTEDDVTPDVVDDRPLRVFAIARREKIPTYRAADRLGEKRIESVRRLKRTWI